jgi:hypothetical protein
MEQLDTLFSLKQSYEADFEKNNETLFRVEEAINRKYKIWLLLFVIYQYNKCHYRIFKRSY